ncbi:ADP-ribosylglycohydrolase family protein [Sulfurimonas sp. SAG-AH-194-L11]|nr:ADP-ribosylglycohydrolase family protein [Sulfurimonas sp. SAG-AH-194-L11]MDF1876908.1 ADP-ribosylglycohydrolase family protein [Sulfurimonas sp. SAG-AH-194-L11]
MNQESIKNAVEASLIADSYLLGSHWIYDEEELKNLDIDWNELNAPCAQWHVGKEKGDFTHYGDHTKWLLDYVKESKTFDIEAYKQVWLKNMKNYKGYIDGACQETMQIIQNDATAVVGSNSHDLSILGRISPLLYVSDTKEVFLSNVKSFVSFTHNNKNVLHVSKLFASMLYDVVNGSSIKDALSTVTVVKEIRSAFDAGVSSQNQNTFDSIQHFGPSCDVEGGFEGTLHLLVKYDNFKEVMLQNAKAGGDSSSRGMIVAMLMGAEGCSIPPSWRKATKGI